METPNDDKNLEIYIADMLIGDVHSYGDAIWAKNIEYAKKLIEDKKPFYELRIFELHAVIAYAGLWLMDCEVEDAQTAKLFDEMRNTFWKAVETLCKRKIDYGVPKRSEV